MLSFVYKLVKIEILRSDSFYIFPDKFLIKHKYISFRTRFSDSIRDHVCIVCFENSFKLIY